MIYLLLIGAIGIFYFSLRGVIQRYNNLNSTKDLMSYRADVIGLISGLGLIIVCILKLLGFKIS